MAKYANFKSNLEVLRKADAEDLTNEFVQSGVINKFSLQFELSWKLLAKLLTYEGMLSDATGSPRGVIKSAFKAYDFVDEEIWLQMLADRNAALHVYDEEMAMRLVDAIVNTYVPAFDALKTALEENYGEEFLLEY